MAGRIFATDHFFARPHDGDRRVEQPSKLFEIESRPLAESHVQHWIVGIIRGTADDPGGSAAFGGEVDDGRLAFGKVGDVAAHVVEQYRQILDSRLAELFELARK